jgi:hypothetical protein
MNAKGAGAMLYFLIGAVVLVIILLAPYPYFNTKTNAWYTGAPLAQRLLGVHEPGIPFEKVSSQVANDSINSPFDIECTTDDDCIQYVVTNQCMVYCGNKAPGNKNAQSLLENNRVCDSGSWSPPTIRCNCVYSKCINLR